jgi:antirestriction protein ArdC
VAYRKTSTGKNPPTNNDVYKRVTERLIAALERGEQPPWQRPWKLIGGMPMSMSTGKRYTGCNPWLLMATSMERGYSSRWWGTAHQVNELGGHITKGQNQASGCGATPVIFFKTLDRAVTDPATGEVRTEKFPMARIFHLFNFEQCAGLPEKYAAPKLDDLEKLPEPEKVLAAYFEHGGPELRHGGNSAHYSPQADVITLPQPGAFRSPAHYAAVAAHEAVHSSGHPSRLNRPGIAEFDHFGSAKYSAEELCAQFGSALICAETGVEQLEDREMEAA